MRSDSRVSQDACLMEIQVTRFRSEFAPLYCAHVERLKHLQAGKSVSPVWD